MNLLDIAYSSHYFEEPIQKRIIPLFSSDKDYEEEKKLLQKQNFSPEIYEIKIKELAKNYNL